MKTTFKYLVVVNCLILLVSCGSLKNSESSNRIIRQAENTPSQFLPAEGVSLDQNSCKSPMIDSADGTEIVMVTSTNGEGNYRVPQGKYGVQKGELLRLNCSTGKVLGIVKE